MLQKASVHNPTHVACHVDGVAWASISDGQYAGINVSFADEAGLRAFVLSLVRALADPGQPLPIQPDPDEDWNTDLIIDRRLEEA